MSGVVCCLLFVCFLCMCEYGCFQSVLGELAQVLIVIARFRTTMRSALNLIEKDLIRSVVSGAEDW